jgi:hypothetical protein
MKILAFCALVACLAGCIPIGIRGTSITSVDPPSCAVQSQIDTPLGPGIATGTTGKRVERAPMRCA